MSSHINSIGSHRENLRSRFNQVGLDGFSSHEIVELLLIYSIPRKDVKPLAKALIKRFGNLRQLLDAQSEELNDVVGMGPATSTFLRIVKQVSQLYLTQKTYTDAKQSLDSRLKLKQFWTMRLCGERNEIFEMAYLDGEFNLLPEGIERLSEGAINQLTISPREVLKSVLNRGNCHAVVLCHNHPNNVCFPSEHDERLTKVIEVNLRTVGVQLIDHLIVAGDRAYSMKEQREI